MSQGRDRRLRVSMEVHLGPGGPHGLHKLLGRASDGVFCCPIGSPVGT